MLTTYVIRQAKNSSTRKNFPIYTPNAKTTFNGYLFKSQFGYCPLVWMKNSRTSNYCIKGLHKRALSLVYSDFSSSFSELLEKDKSVTIAQRCKVEVLKLSCMAQKIYLVWDQKYLKRKNS